MPFIRSGLVNVIDVLTRKREGKVARVYIKDFYRFIDFSPNIVTMLTGTEL